jgi:hypothetical protein
MRILLLFIAFAESTAAALVEYRDFESFVAAFPDLKFESFEAAPVLPYGIHPSLNLGLTTLECPGGWAILDQPGGGKHATDGVKYAEFIASAFTIRFSEKVRAFGITVIDYGDLPDGLTKPLYLSTSSGDVALVADSPGYMQFPDGNEIFFGFKSSSPISSVTILCSGPETVALDAVYFGIPEVSASWHVGTGLVLCCATLRRRRLLNAGRNASVPSPVRDLRARS